MKLVLFALNLVIMPLFIMRVLVLMLMVVLTIVAMLVLVVLMLYLQVSMLVFTAVSVMTIICLNSGDLMAVMRMGTAVMSTSMFVAV
jgi:hypothetical protein